MAEALSAAEVRANILYILQINGKKRDKNGSFKKKIQINEIIIITSPSFLARARGSFNLIVFPGPKKIVTLQYDHLCNLFSFFPLFSLFLPALIYTLLCTFLITITRFPLLYCIKCVRHMLTPILG